MDDIQAFRLERLFRAYEDGNGFVTLDSFTGHVAELARMRGQDPDDARHTALIASLHEWWGQLAAVADIDHDGRVSRAEWDKWAEGMLAFLADSVASGQPWPLDSWVDTLFGVVDVDGDGHITLEEYRDWLTVLHLTDGTDVAEVFAGLDTNGDGYLSRDEFADVTRNYWTNFDATIPAHRWLGP